MKRIGLYCRSNVIGGAERSLLNLIAAHQGNEELVAISPSLTVIDAVAAECPHIERHRFEPGESAAHDVIRHRRAFAQLDLDLVQITMPNPFFARSATLAAYSLRLPTVAVQQLVLPPRRRRGALLVRALSRPLAATIAVGERTASELVRLFGLDRERVHVVYNGIPTPAPPATEAGRAHGPLIGCVARYEDQKGIDRLIRAVADIPDVSLLLVGDGARRDDLIDLVAELGLSERVEVGPWRTDARSLIAAFDVFALASLDEAFPLTIVEAMLACTPVVATDVGSVGEAIVDGSTGLLVESGDHDALVSAIRSQLEDRTNALKMAAAARELAEQRFTSAQMADGYSRVWRSVLSD